MGLYIYITNQIECTEIEAWSDYRFGKEEPKNKWVFPFFVFFPLVLFIHII